MSTKGSNLFDIKPFSSSQKTEMTKAKETKESIRICLVFASVDFSTFSPIFRFLFKFRSL